MNLIKRLPAALFFIAILIIALLYYINRSYYLISLDFTKYAALWIVEAAILGLLYLLVTKTKIKIRRWHAYLIIVINVFLLHLTYSKTTAFSEDYTIIKSFTFLGNVIITQMSLFLVATFIIAWGGTFLKILKIKDLVKNDHLNLFGFGIIAITFLLFFVAYIGQFNPLVLWLILLIPIIPSYKKTWNWLKDTTVSEIDNKYLNKKNLTLFFLFSMLISMQFIGALKLFPIGYDASKTYQFISKGIYESESLISGFQAYNWPLFTAFCAKLFDYFSISIYASHLMIIACFWIIFTLAKSLLSLPLRWLVIAILSCTPILIYFGMSDSKVDLAFLFFQLFLIKLILDLPNVDAIKGAEGIKFLVLIGITLGFLIGIKYLAFFYLATIVGLLVYRKMGLDASLGIILIGLSMIFGLKLYGLAYLQFDNMDRWVIFAVLLFAGIFLLYKSVKKNEFISIFKGVSIIAIVSMVYFSPWMVKNAKENGNLSFSSLLIGKENLAPLNFNYRYLDNHDIEFQFFPKHRRTIESALSGIDIDSLSDRRKFQLWIQEVNPKDIRILNSDKDLKQNEAIDEEIKRYIGYDGDFLNYLTLPYDVTMGSAIPFLRSFDFGFWLLIFVPFILYFSYSKKRLLAISLWSIGFLALLIISIQLNFYKYGDRTASEFINLVFQDTNGFVSSLSKIFLTPILWLFTDLIGNHREGILNIFEKIPKSFTLIFYVGIGIFIIRKIHKKLNPVNSKLNYIIYTASVYGFFWFFFGNGIPGYALLTWLMVVVFFIWFIFTFLKGSGKKLMSRTGFALVLIALTLQFISSYTNQQNNWERSENLFSEAFVNTFSNSTLPETNYDYYGKEVDKIIKTINHNKQDKIYKISTYIGFQIDDKLNRCYDDDLLQVFDRTSKLLVHPEDYLKLLKSKGIKYILVDLNINQIDQTADKSLIQKASNFAKLLNLRDKIRLVGTNNIIEYTNPQTGQVERNYGIYGRTVKKGNIACFEIL